VESLVVIGIYTFFYGSTIHSYSLLLLGRIIFGFGGESIKLCNSAIEALWFKSSQIAFVMSIDYCIANLGTFANDTFAPFIYEKTKSVNTVFFIGFMLCLFSFICSTFVYCFDQIREKQLSLKIKPQSEQKSIFQTIKEFPIEYWLTMTTYVGASSAIAYFNNISSEFLQFRFNFGLKGAGFLIGLEAIVSGFSAPFLGSVLDKSKEKLNYSIFLIEYNENSILRHYVFISSVYLDILFCYWQNTSDFAVDFYGNWGCFKLFFIMAFNSVFFV